MMSDLAVGSGWRATDPSPMKRGLKGFLMRFSFIVLLRYRPFPDEEGTER
jgi:hypothetical protein